ncbi:MAG: hypothetical protein H3C47_03335 [Candidatus Cloacimonetes bacterium]|nr:hypothetical protein [Candidatus Cloacimonadota bacterium]
MRFVFLLCILFQGCLFQDSDGKASDLPNDDPEAALLMPKTVTKWLLVGSPEGQCSEIEQSNEVEIEGLIFKATLKSSSRLRLQVEENDLADLGLEDVDQPIPFTASVHLKNLEIKAREGGARFDKSGDCLLQGGFLITVTRN